MAFPLRGFGKVLSILYADKMSIYHRHEVENDDGTTDIIIDTSPYYVDIPCRLSYTRSYDRPDKVTVDSNNIELMPTIHCDPEIVTKSGDYCVLSRCQDDGSTFVTVEGVLGDSRWYANHQEILMHVKEAS